jgi:hypothetical protein
MADRLAHVYQAGDEHDGGWGPVYPTLDQAQRAAEQGDSPGDFKDYALTWRLNDEDPNWPVWSLLDEENDIDTYLRVYRWEIKYGDGA